MTRYGVIEENVDPIGEFQGETIWRPKYRCKNCSKAIKESYIHTSGECYNCNNNLVAVGDHIECVYSMTVYMPDVEKTNFIQAIYDLKDNSKNIKEFSDLLEQGFTDYPLSDSELITVPPSGTADSNEDNHMIPIGREISDRVEIPFRDITYKKEDYPSQKQLGVEERLKNVRGKIGCTDNNIDADSALIIDDIATSCATLSATAQALNKSGVPHVKGLVIARDENIKNLKFANILKEVEE